MFYHLNLVEITKKKRDFYNKTNLIKLVDDYELEIRELLMIEEKKSLKKTQSSSLSSSTSTSESDSMSMELMKNKLCNKSSSIKSYRKSIYNIYQPFQH